MGYITFESLEEMESRCCPTHRVASQFLNLFKAFENAGPSCSSSFDVLTFLTFVSFMRPSNTFDAFSLDLYGSRRLYPLRA